MLLATPHIHGTDDIYFSVDEDEFLADHESLSYNEELTNALGEIFFGEHYVSDWNAIGILATNVLGAGWSKRTGWSGNVENLLDNEFSWAILESPDETRSLFVTGYSPAGMTSYSRVYDIVGDTDTLEFPATRGYFQCGNGHRGEYVPGYFTPEMVLSGSVHDSTVPRYYVEGDDSTAYPECPIPGCCHVVQVAV